MKKSTLLACLWLAASHVFAQNQLTVSDVRNSWVVRQGTIEAATLSLRPQGLYMECGLYLTFSAQGASFNTFGDSLEVVLNFTLPEGSTVHDSWLWVGDDIVQARILDRWSATNIYEGIVKRRQDPSILTKKSATQYQLRVFPMHKNSTRRVKITWLQPLNFKKNQTELALPYHILQASKNVVPQLNLLVWTDDRFKKPAIAGNPSIAFAPKSDPQLGSYSSASISSNFYSEGSALRLSSPFRDGFYLSAFDDGNEQFYQMALQPRYFLPTAPPRKVAVLLDYSAVANAPSQAALLDAAKNELLNSLDSTDSFNLFFSNLLIGKAANHWLPAHPDTIQKVFTGLQNPISSYSNLMPLLQTGVAWVQAYGADGEIVLATNSSQVSELTQANELLHDFETLLVPAVPVHVVNFNQSTYPYIWLGGTYYYASSYFLYNLAGISGGICHQTLNTQTLANAFSKCFSELENTLESFDLSVEAEGGFCYGEFGIGQGSSLLQLDRPFVQLGKFVGGAPFYIELNGLQDNQLIHFEVEIPASGIVPADTLLRDAWYGRYLQALETEQQTQNVINTVLFNSLRERVLSKYSAFLCLENQDWICEECVDETQTTTTEDLNATRDSTLTAQPNPFADRTTIVVQMPSATKIVGQPTLEIFDATGRLVRLFDLSLQSGQARMEWDGTALSGGEAAPGVYVAMLKMNGQTRTLKLVKVRP